MRTRKDVTDAFVKQLAMETVKEAAIRGSADYEAGLGLLDNPYSFCTPINEPAFKAWGKAYLQAARRDLQL